MGMESDPMGGALSQPVGPRAPGIVSQGDAADGPPTSPVLAVDRQKRLSHVGGGRRGCAGGPGVGGERRW